MGSDMVVAVGPATADGRTLLGLNHTGPENEVLHLVRRAGETFEAGQTTQTSRLRLPQPRRTATLLAGQASGEWGYRHGVNEHNVAIGLGRIATRLTGTEPGLSGPDLVRLGLERATSARQGVDLLADLVVRYGQREPGAEGGAPGQSPVLLVAGPREAFLMIVCGSHWVLQEIQARRSVGEACEMHQGWDRLSPGLAGLAITGGWWPADGSKLDFEQALGLPEEDRLPGLHRLARAGLLLGQPHPDVAALRRLLADHYDGCPDEIDPCDPYAACPSICRHSTWDTPLRTTGSLVAHLQAAPTGRPLVWYAIGAPCASVYLPLFLEGDLPPALRPAQGEGAFPLGEVVHRLQAEARGDAGEWHRLRQAVAALQGRVDLQTAEVLEEAALLQQREGGTALAGLLGSFVQHQAEQLEDLCLAFGRDSLARRGVAPLT